MRYERDARFSAYLLEDSWVLSIIETDSELRFLMDMVLTPEHPDYTPPAAGEQQCYRPGELYFSEVRTIEWLDKAWAEPDFHPAIDATGTIDFGNIDAFEIGPEDQYGLEGEWGVVRVMAAKAEVRLD